MLERFMYTIEKGSHVCFSACIHLFVQFTCIVMQDYSGLVVVCLTAV